MWSPQTCLSFSAYHALPATISSMALPYQIRHEPTLPYFIRAEFDDAARPLHVEGNWFVSSRMLSSVASRASHLVSLDLSDCLALTPTCFSSLAQLSLQHLSLARTSFSDLECSNLSSLHRLESLNLLGCCVGDSGVAHLSSLTNLKHLFIGGPWYHSNGVARIPSAAPTLRSWKVIGSSMRRLEILVVRNVPLSRESHLALSTLRELRELSIEVVGFEGSSPDLTPLLLVNEPSHTFDAPSDLSFLTDMPYLQCLRLDTLLELTREGAAVLAGKGELLSTLILHNCALTLAVFHPFLQYLHNVEQLIVLRCHLAAKQLVETFPKLQRMECTDGFDVESDSTHPLTSGIPTYHVVASTATATLTTTSTTHSAATSTGGASMNAAAIESLSDLPFSLHQLAHLHHSPRYAFLKSPKESSKQDSDSDSDSDSDDDDTSDSVRGHPLEPVFKIPSLTQLDVDLGSTHELFASILSSSPSLRHLSVYDDEEGEEASETLLVRGTNQLNSGLGDSLRLPILPHLHTLVSYSASLRPSWVSSMCELFLSAPQLVQLSLSSGNPAARFPPLLDAVLRSLSSLESLELRDFRDIASLSSIPYLTRLTSLHIVGACPEKGKSTTLDDISQSTSILHLSITYSPEISDSDIRTIIKRMSQLEELDLTSVPRITDRTLKRLTKPDRGLKNLTTIRLKYCPLITPSGLLSLLKLKKLYQIVTTVPSRFIYSEDQTLIDAMFSNFTNNFIAIN